MLKKSALLSACPHPLPYGFIIYSPGSQFRYRVIGPCCRLYDREQLPWPCCRIQWHSKEPSWRRIGNRFVPDMAAKRYPSYSVELIGYSQPSEPIILTLYTDRLAEAEQAWWYTRRLPPDVEVDQATGLHPQPSAPSPII